jgi:acyl-CoA thioesterase-1
MAMAVAALLACRWVNHSLALGLLRITGAIGAVLVLASSTPFPLWVYCIWVALWIAAFLLPAFRRNRLILPSFILLSVLLCLIEVPHHRLHWIPINSDQHIYVIGDSLSAGVGSAERTWPLLLGDISHLKVTNLAQPGATASSALSQVNGVALPNSLVLVEIGGNDLLGTTSSTQFSKDLDTLLSKIPSSCSCAMFELPLLPFHGGFGAAQRTLASKHHIILIPKEVLTEAIGGSGDTIDGLHLSQQGHDTLAVLTYGDLLIKP